MYILFIPLDCLTLFTFITNTNNKAKHVLEIRYPGIFLSKFEIGTIIVFFNCTRLGSFSFCKFSLLLFVCLFVLFCSCFLFLFFGCGWGGGDMRGHLHFSLFLQKGVPSEFKTSPFVCHAFIHNVRFTFKRVFILRTNSVTH